MLILMLFFWGGLLALLLWVLANVVRSERRPAKARALSEEHVRVRRIE